MEQSSNQKRQQTIALVSLALIEVILLFGSIYCGALLVSKQPVGIFSYHWQFLTLIAVIYSVIVLSVNSVFGLYQPETLAKRREQMPRLILALFSSMIVVAQVSYLFPVIDLGHREWLSIILISYMAMTLLRHLVVNRMSQDLFKKRVLVLGAGQKALKLRESVKSATPGTTIIGYVHLRGERARIDTDDVLYSIGSLIEYAKSHAVNEIVVAVDDRRNGFPLEELLTCRLNGIDVTDLLAFYERELGQVMLDILDPSWLIFSDGFKQSPISQFVKRTVDITMSVSVLILTAPLISFALLLLTLQNGRQKPWFLQQNVHGLAGTEFVTYRLNTSQTGFATKLIKRFGIQSLPQWLNVFRGEMGSIGPNPIDADTALDNKREMAYFSERHMVKPGMIGWACVMSNLSRQHIIGQLNYDLFYVKNNSLFLDLVIFFRSLSKLLQTNNIDLCEALNQTHALKNK